MALKRSLEGRYYQSIGNRSYVVHMVKKNLWMIHMWDKSTMELVDTAEVDTLAIARDFIVIRELAIENPSITRSLGIKAYAIIRAYELDKGE